MSFFSPVVHRWGGAALALLLTLPAAVAAQDTLTLRSALVRGTANAVSNRAARASLDAAGATRLAAWRSVLPAARVEAGFARTTDPVGAFGTALRQQRITAQDFNPDRLNYPPAVNNFTGALVIEQPILVVDGWLAARAASQGIRGASLNADWAAMTIEANVIATWFGAMVAADRARTVSAATLAAEGHARQAQLMLDAGLVTRSDVLLARARAGELEASRLDAVRDSVIARRRLGALIGVRANDPVVVQGRFPDDTVLARTAAEVERLEVRPRADVEAARSAHAASAADVQRATASMLPRLYSFARRDLHSGAHPFGGASNWTVGVVASWSLFNGAAELADRNGAAARRAGTEAQLAGAEANAEVDVEQAALTLRAAGTRLTIARRNVEYAQEAHRIVARKYAGGLATVLELLDAAAAEMQSQLQLSAARHGLIVAMADHLRAHGHSPARLVALDDLTPTNH